MKFEDYYLLFISLLLNYIFIRDWCNRFERKRNKDILVKIWKVKKSDYQNKYKRKELTK